MSSINAPKFKTQKTAFYILLTYIFVFQLSGIVFVIPGISDFALGLVDAPEADKGAIINSWWSFATGLLSVIIMLALVRGDKSFFNIFKEQKATIPQSIGWGVIGFFLIFFGQSIGAYIEMAIGIDPGSDNTQTFLKIAKIAPIMMLVIAVIGPILEELVFRRVIFGSLIQVQSFWLSAIVSGVIFAAIHLDFEHIILYTICGLIFAFLYYKTKRIITSIISHILLNSFVLLVQLNGDKLQQFLDSMPK